MVDFTLADLVGGEMLFPGKISVEQDREQRIAHMERLFAEALQAMRQADYVTAKACLDGLMLCFTIANSVHAEQVEADREGGENPSPSARKRRG